MPAYVCKCGERVSYSEIPSPSQYLFISDVDYDKYQGEIDAETLYLEMKSFLVCGNCGRIWMFWNGFKHEPREYLPGT